MQHNLQQGQASGVVWDVPCPNWISRLSGIGPERSELRLLHELTASRRLTPGYCILGLMTATSTAYAVQRPTIVSY
jgi:hypothetical protein